MKCGRQMGNKVKFQREKVYELNCDNGHRFYIPFIFPMDMLQMVNFLEGVTCPECQVDYKKIKLSSKPLEVVE